MARLAGLLDRLRSSLWLIPSFFGVGAFILAVVTLTIDRELESDQSAFFLFGGTAEGAREVLSTIAQSMLTFTALVFTITMLVLQLASSQLSPRVIRTFLRDRGNQVVLGLFIATFLYTLLVLRDVRSDDAGSEFVPGLSIFVAFALLMASVVAFVYYIDHMAHAIRATSVIANIAAETSGAIDRLFPEALGRKTEPTPRAAAPHASDHDEVVRADKSGTLVAVDEGGLFRVLHDSDVAVELVPMVGEFIPEGSPLFRVRGSAGEDLHDKLRKQLSLGGERTMQQDAAYGFRQLVDVGLRALSPSTNDPTTAVHAIDRLHQLLLRLADRSIPSPVRADDEGTPRVIVRRSDWADYVRLAVDELRLAASEQIQVLRRLRAMLVDLEQVVSPERRPVLLEELEQLDLAVASGFETRRDRDRARLPSQRGDKATPADRR